MTAVNPAVGSLDMFLFQRILRYIGIFSDSEMERWCK